MNYVVRMIRENMEGVRDFPVPPAYSIRTYRPGDEHVWTRIVRAAEPFLKIDDGLFSRQFGRHERDLNDRCFFLVTDAGEEIGTITAWWQPVWRSKEWGELHTQAKPRSLRDPDKAGLDRAQMVSAMKHLWETRSWGHLHWGAIHPDHQGRGLYKPIVSAALGRIKISHARCSYFTSTQRLAAIKTLLDFGFVPDFDGEESIKVWTAVASQLRHPSLRRLEAP